VGGACSTHGGEERCIQVFWWEDLMERDHLKYKGIDKKIILKFIFKKWDGERGTELLWFRTGTGGEHL